MITAQIERFGMTPSFLQRTILPSLRLTIALLAVGLVPVSAVPVSVTLANGDRVSGELDTLTPEAVTVATAYAGTVTLSTDQIVGVRTDAAVHLRFEDGSVLQGRILTEPGGTVALRHDEGVRPFTFSRIRHFWKTDEPDPLKREQQRAAAEAAEVDAQPERKWDIRLAFDINGRSGNVSESSFRGKSDLRLKGERDDLHLFLAYNFRERNGELQRDEARIGGTYSNFFIDDLGWYVRTQFEQDRGENLDLRSTTASGLTYRVLKEERHELTTRLGLSYEHEMFADDQSNDDPGVDVGIEHRYEFRFGITADTDIKFVPNARDFSDYRLLHDTGFEWPITTDNRYILRFGLNNDFKSRPDGDNRSLDTRYYSQLILQWK
ncbi:MAG: DUF481 domain-containing protein [Opitutales bacterium]